MNFLKAYFLLAALTMAVPLWAQDARYAIETHSPLSWSKYYTRIGLGNVDPLPLPDELKHQLEAHCRTLNDLTGFEWFPVGYSLELGYKLCHRKGPFSAEDAKIICDRLELGVAENSRTRIVCGA